MHDEDHLTRRQRRKPRSRAQNLIDKTFAAGRPVVRRRLPEIPVGIAKLGGGIAVQHRMAYQGEYFVERYGQRAAEHSPPIRRMMEAGLPVGAGTDATRVASYNPWVSLSWLVTGSTIGGLRLYPPANRLDREMALRLWTEANTWFSTEVGKKGQITF